jgi:tRNA-dihydrouridine synthase
LRNNVFLAPMSGITDLTFRRIAHDLGAGLVVSEMIASEHLVLERHAARNRAVGRNLAPFVIQLAGCEARWMAEGARMEQELGADIIDINMGCPAREVTGKQAGSALMRDPDHATRLVLSVVGAVGVPSPSRCAAAGTRGEPQRPGWRGTGPPAWRSLPHAHTLRLLQDTPTGPRAPGHGSRARAGVINGDVVIRNRVGRARGVGADAVMVGRAPTARPGCRRIDATPTAGAIRAIRLVEQGGTAPGTQDRRSTRRQHCLRWRKHVGWYLASSGRPPRSPTSAPAALHLENAEGGAGRTGVVRDQAQEMAAATWHATGRPQPAPASARSATSPRCRTRVLVLGEDDRVLYVTRAAETSSRPATAC